MKELTLNEFMNNIPAILIGVTRDGDMVRVDAGKQGAFVIMAEPEYQILRDALTAVFSNATTDDGELLKKLQKQSKGKI
jgi:hypothetical protein